MKRILLTLLIGVILMSNWKVLVGGVALDLEDDYGLHVNRIIGAGSAKSTLSLDRYTLIPGGEVSGAKVQPRTFTLAGTLTGTSQANLHLLRQNLVRLFSDVVTIRYVGAAATKEIEAHYVSGLEFNQQVEDPCYWEKIAIRFASPNPFWYGIAEDSQVLDSIDNVAHFTMSRRLFSDGVWDPMGPPDPLSGFHTILAMARAANGDIYIGGDFWNWDNDVNGSYVARWDATTSTWQPLGVGLDDTVRGIAIDANGQVYIVGAFTDIRTNPGGGTYNHIVRWDPVTSTWNALGAGLDDDTYTVAIGYDGTVYVGGYFHNAGVGVAMHVAQWNGAAWSAVGVGLNSNVFASAVGPDGGIYFAGEFNELFGLPAADYSRIIKWNPTSSTWSDITGGVALNNVLWAVTVAENGTIYFGGDFTTAGALTCNRIGKSNGTAISALGTGVDDRVVSLGIGPDNHLYVGGRMHTAGGVPVSHLAIWNGYTWVYADIELPTIEAVFSILIGEQDTDIPQNYDVYLGSATPVGGESQAGITTVTNNGTASVYPTITFARTGGTSARVLSVRNETTGKTLYFNYNLQDGETLTVTLAPTSKSIVSSAFGPAPNAILPGSDFGTFSLAPGTNDVTCFIDVAGAPAITAEMTWFNAYRSFD